MLPTKQPNATDDKQCGAADDKQNWLCAKGDGPFGLRGKDWGVIAGLFIEAIAGFLFYISWATFHIIGTSIGFFGLFVLMMNIFACK